MEIRELVRRVSCGQSDRAIAQDLGVDRKTVAEYRRWAEAEGALPEGGAALPSESELEELLESGEQRSGRRQESTVAPYREQVTAWLEAGLTRQVIWQRLTTDHGYTGSYTSVRRFGSRLRAAEPAEAFVRVEVPAGEEAQVDFGSAGKVYDPTRGEVRPAQVFVMTLSHSRHQYVELCFDQKVETWLRLHRHAFEFFGGVPQRVVLDNLKAGIVKASLHEPVVQRAYRQLAEHYGFLIAPCRPRTPRHKGKVERGGVAYVKGNFLAGRSFRNDQDANEQALAWTLEVAGCREHGTTKQRPLDVFDRVEHAVLQPLPAEPFTLCCYKEAKIHPDCHGEPCGFENFEGAYYSAPFRLVGQNVLLKATERQVELYQHHELVVVHSRATRRGQRVTLDEHLPPDKAQYLLRTPAWCQRHARQLGRATGELIERLLSEGVLYRLRTAQAILRLADRHGADRLEAACARCLAFEELSYQSLKRILDQGLDKQLSLLEPVAPPPPPGETPSVPPTFARSAAEFFGAGDGLLQPLAGPGPANRRQLS
ncbi:MAG: IS21 family transposase [Armatimonadetes bacterium CG_4_10_14_3_um_filter_66_18]|nr:MAG: IS21 family transposase [Armatimonadetes bacterium CG_4_8_14_3_um_filter_66_20]PIY48990.1 MAG: IS21 family transposase [Armatimonadetes bacterium CG_4_10_14_3_um_filter_66_18]